MLWIDIAVIVLIVIFLFIGWRRGFLVELFRLLKWIFALVSAKLLAGPLSVGLYNKLNITGRLEEQIAKVVDNMDFSSLETVKNTMATGLQEIPFIGQVTDGTLTNNWGITELFQSGVEDMKNSFISLIVKELTPTLMNWCEWLVFIGLFIIFLMIFGVICANIVKVVKSFKITTMLDKVLGCGFGALKGTIFCAILFVIVFVVFTLIGSEYLTLLTGCRFFDILQGVLHLSILGG